MHTFFFLHHGSTDWSDQRLLMGQHDIGLNDKGRQEAEEAGKILVGHEIASLCFSPLLRDKETAQIIAKHCHCGLYPLEGMKERLWGALEGHPYAKEQLLATLLPAGTEAITSFTARVRGGLAAAATYPAPTLIVADDCVLRAICAVLEIAYPENGDQGIIYFFQRLGRWVVKRLDS